MIEVQPHCEYYLCNFPTGECQGMCKILEFIDEFTGAEQERHPMFSEGYDLALLHMKQFIEGRLKEKNT